MVEIGHERKDVLEITRKLPTIYNLSKETLNKRIEDMISFGYRKEDILKMISVFPGIYTYSFENLEQKINYMKEIGIEQTLITHPGNLIQSVELTYARYEYFKDNGIEIDSNNFLRLFNKVRQFEQTYKITKEELLEKYKYEEYLEQIKHQR